MPISDTRKWKINRSSNEIQKILINKLKQKKADIEIATPKMIEATLGSGLKTRLIGGLIVSKETLPVKIILLMTEVGEETEINATIEDNLGFGLRTGMVGKYNEYIQSLFDELARALQE